MINKLPRLFIISLLLLASNIQAKTITTEEYARSAWGDIENVEINTVKINDSLYLLYGVGGNIAVSIGKDGVLIVDDQLPLIFPKIEKAIKRLSKKDIIYTINTHWHWDHADGNLALNTDITKIISHSNARKNMSEGGLINMGVTKLNQDPYPEEALPVITHDNGMTLYFNDEKIDILHFGPAHTTGDSIIYFNNSNAIHFGDVFFSDSYPFIDVDNGGSISGVINFLEEATKIMDSETIVMPGHGNIANLSDVIETIEMLKVVKSKIANMINEGKTLQEVFDAKPTKEFDNKYDISSIGYFIDRVYASLKKDD